MDQTAKPADLTFGLPGGQTPGHIVPGASTAGPRPMQDIAQTANDQLGEQDVTGAAETPSGRPQRKRKPLPEPQEWVDPEPEHSQKRKAGRPRKSNSAVDQLQQQSATTTKIGVTDTVDDEEMLMLRIEQRKATEARLADEMMLHALRKKQR